MPFTQVQLRFLSLRLLILNMRLIWKGIYTLLFFAVEKES